MASNPVLIKPEEMEVTDRLHAEWEVITFTLPIRGPTEFELKEVASDAINHGQSYYLIK